MKQQPNVKQLMTILWGAFFMAIMIYNVIGYLVSGTPGGPLFADTMAEALWVAAACAAAAQLAIPKTPQSKPEAAFSFFIIRLALAEMPAIFGLVLTFTNGDIRHLWYLSAVSAALLLVNNPQRHLN